MAEGDGTLFNNFKEQLLNGLFNMANGQDALHITLHTAATPDIDSHALWADAGVSSTEYSTADGYTADGIVLAAQATSQDDANDRGKFDANDATWSSLGALTPATPSDAIIWDNTAAGDALICFFELGTTATNGGDYTIAFHTDGIILLT